MIGRGTAVLVAALLFATQIGLAVAKTTKANPRSAARQEKTQPAAERFRSAILVEVESGSVLFEKDSHRQAPPASMTKMMLILLVAEAVEAGRMHWEDPITTSASACSMGGSQVYLKQGEVFPLAELMQAIVIHSANDAAVAVAEAMAGSTGAFVERMNARALELGMRETKYRSVHGLPPDKGDVSDLSSAADLARLARELVRFPQILRWSATREAPFRDGRLILTNTNRLVQETNWVDGLKTGYTREAGFNVTATAARAGLRLIAVVMGAAEKKDCFDQAEALLAKGLAEYQNLSAVRAGDVVASDIPVASGEPRFVRVIAGRSLQVLGKRGQKRNFVLELALTPNLEAPLAAQQVVGEVLVKDGTAVLGHVPAVAADPIRRASVWERVF